MNLDNWESWEDYKSLGDNDIVVKLDNDNIKVLTQEEFNTLTDEIEFDSISEFFNGDYYAKFIKNSTYDNVTVYRCSSDQDLYLLTNEDKMSIEYVYQTSGMYEDGNKITITGWDYNIIIKKKNLSSKTKNVR